MLRFITKVLVIALSLGACAHGTINNDVTAGWVGPSDGFIVRQRNEADCGPAALATVLGHWGLHVTPSALMDPDRVAQAGGATASELVTAASKRGMKAFAFSGTEADLHAEITAGRPVIVGILQPAGDKHLVAHYLVVTARNDNQDLWRVADPGLGWRALSSQALMTAWQATHAVTIVVLPGERDAS